MPEEKNKEQIASAKGNVEDLKKELEEYKKQKDEYLSGWQRERADFLNYKKEEMERIGQLINYAREEWILEILPIVDNFEAAKKCLTCDPEKDKNVKGLLMVKNQLQELLKKFGVEEIKSVGEKFDPKFHEIVDEVPFDAAQGKESGVIIEEIQKGYTANGRLLRPAKVKVIK